MAKTISKIVKMFAEVNSDAAAQELLATLKSELNLSKTGFEFGNNDEADEGFIKIEFSNIISAHYASAIYFSFVKNKGEIKANFYTEFISFSDGLGSGSHHWEAIEEDDIYPNDEDTLQKVFKFGVGIAKRAHGRMLGKLGVRGSKADKLTAAAYQ